MDNNPTALQQAMRIVEKHSPHLFDVHNPIGRVFMNEMKLCFDLERKQIIEARVTAPLLSTFDKADYKEEAEQYYAETYGK